MTSPVPFGNNIAERDLRMMKVQQKIFRHLPRRCWRRCVCRIRSYLSTAAKHCLSAAFDVLAMAMPRGPIHANIGLDGPLSRLKDLNSYEFFCSPKYPCNNAVT